MMIPILIGKVLANVVPFLIGCALFLGLMWAMWKLGVDPTTGGEKP